MTSLPAFGLNRFNYTSPQTFAADVKRAEAFGWDYAFIPSSPLLLQDPYVNLAFAAVETSRIGLGAAHRNADYARSGGSCRVDCGRWRRLHRAAPCWVMGSVIRRCG